MLFADNMGAFGRMCVSSVIFYRKTPGEVLF